MINYELLRSEVNRHQYPLLFATISGAHLYGFPSPDSDYDLRGAHVLPAKEALGLLPKRETIEFSGMRDAVELDLVTHDVQKYFKLLLKRNGYVLEQLFSPLVVHTTPEHRELKAIASGCITKNHFRHYRGFAETQWLLFQKNDPPKTKPLLYVYRILLTGIHLMRTGKIEANLATLNQERRFSWIDELIARKVNGPEKGALGSAAEMSFHENKYAELCNELAAAAASSSLPSEPTCEKALHDLLIRIRLPHV